MYNIAVMGDKDSIAGFGALGFNTYFTDDEQSAKTVFKQLADAATAVIYITEKTASMISEDIAKYDESPIPAVILIPGISGNTGAGMRELKNSVEKAVGSDIIFND
ncbi:MAG: V-type ATP synthase subunit F [Clostridiales bacterium]|nr:V-type ATP synthase subunit F [Clostridiales bacterium]